MRNIIATCSVLLCTLLVTGQAIPLEDNNAGRPLGDELGDTLAERLSSTPFRLRDALESFAKKTYAQMAAKETGNIAFSPFSLHVALSMLYYGSPVESETHKELADVLGLPDQFQFDYATNYLQMLLRYQERSARNGGFRLDLANRLFLAEGFTPKEQFLDLMAHFYKAEADVTDFNDGERAAAEMNGFVADKTEGVIRELISETDLDALTRMVLINALYFKSDWLYQFDKELTGARGFTVEPGQSEPFMHERMMFQRGEFGMARAPRAKATVLELPYADDDFRMLIFLPDEAEGGLAELEANFSDINLEALDRRMAYGQMSIMLPAFVAEQKKDFKEVLVNLGVETLFDNELADLSDLAEEGGLAVKFITHQATADVGEEGTEAAAASAVGLGTRSSGGRRRTFIANRPFMYVIQDRALGVPLFVGRVVDPTGQRQLSKPTLGKQAKREIIGSRQREPLISDLLEEAAETVFLPQQQVANEGELPEADFEVVVDAASLLEPEQQPQETFVWRMASAEESGEEDLPDCEDELGYAVVPDPGVSFPCKGRETPDLAAHRERQRDVLDAGLERAVEAHQDDESVDIFPLRS